MDRNYLMRLHYQREVGLAGEVPSEEKWGKDSGIMLLLLITSIYCAPTMCSAVFNAWHALPPGIPGTVYIVHVTDKKMRLREDKKSLL